MNIEQTLISRSNAKCELCGATKNLSVYEIPPHTKSNPDNAILICSTCLEQIENTDKIDPNHWHCLNESMWSEIPAVKVMAWRILKSIKSEGWPQDLLDMLYLDDEMLSWANALGTETDEEDTTKHIDSNGATLENGDTVVLIKDLNVKGANFTAKRGTAVRGITLVSDNPEHIEGRINGQQIVILTKYVKKSN